MAPLGEDTPTDPDRFWVARLNATGRAQSRYLWVLFLACIFYPALLAAIQASGDRPATFHVPIIDLDLDAMLVLASGPAAIGLIVLILMGSLRATKVALEAIGPRWQEPGEMERFDEHPNALELATYVTPKSPKIIQASMFVLYPLVLVAALVEAAWLWFVLGSLVPGTTGWPVLKWIAVFIGVPAGWLVGTMVVKRISKVWRGEFMKPPPVVT